MERLAGLLTQRGEQLATAESCTGGWVAKACTDLAGSSAWFERGFVTYSNLSKQELLAVPAEVLETHGAVSEAVVSAMVEGVLSRSAADWALAISGVAGPGGGSADKPVGTVWLGWGGPQGWRESQCHLFRGDREAVRAQAVCQALAVLVDRCDASQ